MAELNHNNPSEEDLILSSPVKETPKPTEKEITPDQKALDLTSKISEKQQNATSKEDWDEIKKLFEKLKAVYERKTNVEEIAEEMEAGLYEQYRNQVDMMVRLGIVDYFDSGDFGIRGIDGREYPIPTFQEIIENIESRKEFIELKREQGFQRLLLIPFGRQLEELADVYRKLIVEKSKINRLFTTKHDANDPDEKLVTLSIDSEIDPIYMWDEVKGADVLQTLVYWPKEFSKDHRGKTKKEILQTNKNGGWNVILVEKNPNIPTQDSAKTFRGREQISNRGNSIIRGYIDEQGTKEPSPDEYLRAINVESHNLAGPYYGESGMTPEDQLMYAITYLEEHNQVIDDYRANGNMSYQIGSYLILSENVPTATWDAVDNNRNYKFIISSSRSDARTVLGGIRTSVRIQ